MAAVGIVHLVWAPYGSEPLRRFLRSYLARPAGIQHRLLVVLNGFGSGALPPAFAEPLAEVSHDWLRPRRALQDLAAYRLAAERAAWADTLCFVNSHAEPLVDGWAALLRERLEEPGVGLVGATGSHESTLTAAPRPLKPLRALEYPPFPNAHIRTNGFMLRRDHMLALDWAIGRSKGSAHRLESGRRYGVTRQLAARGLAARVVGRDGRAFAPEEWPASETYRSGAQDNLLIADNRTRQYDEASPERRAELARMAWGDAARPEAGTYAPAPAADGVASGKASRA